MKVLVQHVVDYNVKVRFKSDGSGVWVKRLSARTGMLSLSKRFSDKRLEAACVMACSLGTAKYTHIRDILVNRRDLLQASPTEHWSSPAHAHVRGPGYYQ